MNDIPGPASIEHYQTTHWRSGTIWDHNLWNTAPQHQKTATVKNADSPQNSTTYPTAKQE